MCNGSLLGFLVVVAFVIFLATRFEFAKVSFGKWFAHFDFGDFRKDKQSGGSGGSGGGPVEGNQVEK